MNISAAGAHKQISRMKRSELEDIHITKNTVGVDLPFWSRSPKNWLRMRYKNYMVFEPLIRGTKKRKTDARESCWVPQPEGSCPTLAQCLTFRSGLNVRLAIQALESKQGKACVENGPRKRRLGGIDGIQPDARMPGCCVQAATYSYL